MSKNFFQRLIAVALIFTVLILAVPSVFKDFVIIIIAIVLFFSTFELRKKKKKD